MSYHVVTEMSAQVSKLQVHNAYLEAVLRHERSRAARAGPAPEPAGMMKEAAVAAQQQAQPHAVHSMRAMADRFEVLKQLNTQLETLSLANSRLQQQVQLERSLKAAYHGTHVYWAEQEQALLTQAAASMQSSIREGVDEGFADGGSPCSPRSPAKNGCSQQRVEGVLGCGSRQTQGATEGDPTEHSLGRAAVPVHTSSMADQQGLPLNKVVSLEPGPAPQLDGQSLAQARRSQSSQEAVPWTSPSATPQLAAQSVSAIVTQVAGSLAVSQAGCSLRSEAANGTAQVPLPQQREEQQAGPATHLASQPACGEDPACAGAVGHSPDSCPSSQRLISKAAVVQALALQPPEAGPAGQQDTVEQPCMPGPSTTQPQTAAAGVANGISEAAKEVSTSTANVSVMDAAHSLQGDVREGAVASSSGTSPSQRYINLMSSELDELLEALGDSLRLLVFERQQQVVATRAGIKPAASGTKKMNVGKEMDQARDFFNMWKLNYSRKIANMEGALRRLDADGAIDTRAAADLAGLVIKYSIWMSEARIMLRATENVLQRLDKLRKKK